MNWTIKGLEIAIHDAEWRLGSYLAIEGNSKDDEYAKRQIDRIYQWNRDIEAIIANGGKMVC